MGELDLHSWVMGCGLLDVSSSDYSKDTIGFTSVLNEKVRIRTSDQQLSKSEIGIA